MEKVPQNTNTAPKQTNNQNIEQQGSDKAENSDEIITIKIQTMDNAFHLIWNKNSTVLELKEKISSQYKIPATSQRLIYQGRLMKDSDTWVNSKITNDCVIHLVARALEETDNNQSSNNPTANQQPQTNINRENSENQSQNSQQQPHYEEILPVIQIPFRSNRRRRRVIMPHYDISESFEALYQNVLAWDNFKKCKKNFNFEDKDTNLKAKTTTNTGGDQSGNSNEWFDFNKTTYEVGQWVDVKDTIEQWLEAQVIQVNENKAYVHYNGWGTRWDEWIDFDSPRIRNFKVYTLQSPGSFFMCPYPGIPCDSNVEPQSRSIDSFYYWEKCKEYMQWIMNDIDKMMELRKKDGRKNIFKDNKLNTNDQEIMFMTGQWIPLLDRCGRMMSDISMQFSHLVVNPNYYPQMLLGYKRDDVFKEIQEINEQKNKLVMNTVVSQTNNSFPWRRNQENMNSLVNNMFGSQRNRTQDNNSNQESGENDKDKEKEKEKSQDKDSKSSDIQSQGQEKGVENKEIKENTPQLNQITPEETQWNNNWNNIVTTTNISNTNQTEHENNPNPNPEINTSNPNTPFNQNNPQTHNQPINNLQNSSNIPQQVPWTQIQTNLGYNLSHSSGELPFIQRIISSYTPSDRIVSPNSHVSSLNSQQTLFPQINFQVPSLLSSGEVMMMTGYSPFSEPNFDIYVHTIVTNPNQPRAQTRQNLIPNNNTTNSSNSQEGSNQLTQSQNWGNENEMIPQISQRVGELLGMNNETEVNNSESNRSNLILNENISENRNQNRLENRCQDQCTQTDTEEKEK